VSDGLPRINHLQIGEYKTSAAEELNRRQTLNRRIALFMLVGVLVGCTSATPSPEATRWRTTLVTATGTNVPGNVQGVAEQFTFEGRIHAHATLVAETPVIAQNSAFAMKWFNGTKLVHERSGIAQLKASPYYLVHAIPGSVLGVGDCRVELYAGSVLLASRKFSVVER
jgi:hypothetical protein